MKLAAKNYLTKEVFYSRDLTDREIRFLFEQCLNMLDAASEIVGILEPLFKDGRKIDVYTSTFHFVE